MHDIFCTHDATILQRHNFAENSQACLKFSLVVHRAYLHTSYRFQPNRTKTRTNKTQLPAWYQVGMI